MPATENILQGFTLAPCSFFHIAKVVNYSDVTKFFGNFFQKKIN